MEQTARLVAAQALMRQQAAKSYSNLLIEPAIVRARLAPREAAFATALFFTALERLPTITHILRHYCTRPLQELSPAALATLQLGVSQLMWMDGVDDYAAVSESVELARQLGAPHVTGLVNGLLRSLLRDEKHLPPVKGDRAEQLSVEYACPAWLVRIWLESYGEPATVRMLAGSLGKPPDFLRVNLRKISPEALAERLAAEGISACPTEPEGCMTVEGRLAPTKLASFQEGLFHLQDRASQLCAAALDVHAGMRVLDVCAAPGGKSFTLAGMMDDSGELVARDLHPKRVALIAQGAERLGYHCIKAVPGDATVYDPTLGEFDRVLCDVPCSGFGIIRRKPEIKYKSPEEIQNLPQIQNKILAISAQYLKADGLLVYSTCTLLPQENEQVVDRFLAENPGFVCEHRETFTGERLDTDGFFVSVIRKR